MNKLSDLFIKFANEYPGMSKGEYEHNKTTDILTEELPQRLYQLSNLSVDDYKIYGSVGIGNWVEIPWLGLLDRRITESTREGYYIAYLFDSNMKYLYLCLGLGWTQFEEEFGTKEGRYKIREYCDHYAAQLNKDGFESGEIQLHAKNNLGKGYQAGTVLSRRYDINKLEAIDLLSDLVKMISIYSQLKSVVGDSILNLTIDEKHEEIEMEAFNRELAANTFKEINNEVIQKLLIKTKNNPPVIRDRMIKQIVRNRKFATYIKQQKSYICEVCGRLPFVQRNGQLYAEADHIIPLGGSNLGLDRPENMRCLCAQCHVIITHGSDEEIRKLLQQ